MAQTSIHWQSLSEVMSQMRLLIMACSQRKRPDPGLLPAIERYDGPQFRVLRKFIREMPEQSLNVRTYILSAQYGIIPAGKEVLNYDRRMTHQRAIELRPQIQNTLSSIFQTETYNSVFVNVGDSYLEALQGYESLLPPNIQPIQVTGSQGRRQGQLRDWLLLDIEKPVDKGQENQSSGSTIIRGEKIELSRSQILECAQQAIAAGVTGFDKFQTWYVEIGNLKVSPKWLVSQLTGLPVNKFHSGDARRVLQQLGIEVKKT